MEFTTNYNLKKPGQDDYVVIGDLNDNADSIDAAMKQLQDNITAGNNIRATGTQLGNVIVGANISVNNGTISIPNASTSTMGVIRVGDGLSSSNGVVNSYVLRENEISFETSVADLKTGITTSYPILNPADNLYKSCTILLNQTLGLNMPEDTSLFRYKVITEKMNSFSNVIQTLYVMSNVTNNVGITFLKLVRNGNSSGGWTSWKVEYQLIENQGNPNGIITAFLGCLVYDSSNGVIYRKTTGTSSLGSGGWVQIDAGTVNTLATLQNSFNTHLSDYTDHVPYVADSGTANAKVVTLNPAPTTYVEGMAIAFKNNTQNTGAVTINVNGLGAKSIVKSNGNALSSGNLRANSVYTVRYSGTSFFLQGEGGEYGTATPSQVLRGYTVGTENGLVEGNITNVGTITTTLDAGAQYNIPGGYHNGGGVVRANSLSSQTQANATAAQILAGRTAWVNGTQITGNIVNRGRSALGQGYATAKSVRGDTGGGITVEPQTGYYEEGLNNLGFGSIFASAPDYIPQNIVSGKSIFGVSGTATVQSLGGKVFARGSGNFNLVNGLFEVTSLNFAPNIVIAKVNTEGSSSNNVAVFANRNQFSTTLTNDVSLNAYSNSVYDADFTQFSNGFRIRINNTSNTVNISWIAFQ